eukprot:4120145-Amphidinium_carterae.2
MALCMCIGMGNGARIPGSPITMIGVGARARMMHIHSGGESQIHQGIGNRRVLGKVLGRLVDRAVKTLGRRVA